MVNSTALMHIEPMWSEEVEKKSGVRLSSCFQCGKCTNGCPLTFAMDIYPDKVIRLVQMGQKERVLSSSTIWVCSACETCTTRCPNGVDVAGVMDYMKETAIRNGITIPHPNTYVFHKIFFDEIRKRGRISEAWLMKNYLLRSGEFRRKWKDKSVFEDLSLAWTMFKKGRMPIFPRKIKGMRDIRQIVKK